MSLKRSFQCAISKMIALEACGALEYSLEQGRHVLAMAKANAIQRDCLICTIDKAGAFLSVNAAMRRRLGRYRRNIEGLGLHDVHSAEIADVRLKYVMNAITSRQTQHIRDSMDGQCFEGMIIPIMNQSGTCNRALCIAIPVRDCEDGKMKPIEQSGVLSKLL